MPTNSGAGNQPKSKGITRQQKPLIDKLSASCEVEYGPPGSSILLPSRASSGSCMLGGNSKVAGSGHAVNPALSAMPPPEWLVEKVRRRRRAELRAGGGGRCGNEGPASINWPAVPCCVKNICCGGVAMAPRFARPGGGVGDVRAPPSRGVRGNAGLCEPNKPGVQNCAGPGALAAWRSRQASQSALRNRRSSGLCRQRAKASRPVRILPEGSSVRSSATTGEAHEATWSAHQS
mmetsp:Transcript_8729/g.25146  ORF Transcript_8729/g.25146 Transcript_8729/m.25146 type:complete len:234 (-) Transcript_8729:1050-1751(-)